jgi:hypothetical protein
MKKRRTMAKKPTSKPAAIAPGTVTYQIDFTEGTAYQPKATIGNDMQQVAGMTVLSGGSLKNSDTRTCYAIPNGGVTGRYVHLEFTPSELDVVMQIISNGGLTGQDPLPQNVVLCTVGDGSIVLFIGDAFQTIAPAGTFQVGVKYSGTLDLGAVYTFRNFGCHPSNLNGCWEGTFHSLKLSV